MSTRTGSPPGEPTLEQLQLLGVELVDVLDKLAERHNIPRPIVADAVEGFCVGLAVGAGETRREYLQRLARLYDTIAASRPTVGQS